MKSLKKNLCVVLMCFSVSSAFAAGWYVCFGSFKIASNANEFSAVLEQERLPNAVIAYDKADGTLYRVVYDGQFEDVDEARIFKNGLIADARIQSLGISGLWVCEDESGSGRTEGAWQGEALQTNNIGKLPISEDVPWSFKIRSYKEERPALQNSERLRQNDIDAYVVKTYDDEDFFVFSVHAGAFESPEEGEALQEALSALGIEDVELSDYSEINENMQRYDEIVQNGDVVFETAAGVELPDFSPEVQVCLSDLPVNKNFLVESVVILDFDTIFMADTSRFDEFEEYFLDDGVHACSKAVYYDDLFGKRVEVCVMEGDDGVFDELFDDDALDALNEDAVQFSLPGNDILTARISLDGNVHSIVGINRDGTVFISIDAYDFSEEEFSEFMENAWSDSATIVYPQLRKSLCLLPRTTETKRDFAAFTLSVVDESYAIKRGNADWAIPIVGHWNASGYFLQDDELVSVDFFDMDYEHNAQRIHQIFMDEHESSIISTTNHFSTVNGTDAWYVEVFSKEISFSKKSFIIAVDAESDSSFGEDALTSFASDLRIWDE